jgi:hypothetical protein
MDDRITIIEGPTPNFEQVNDGWALGINESPYLYDLALTKLRTYNGPALIERCHKAWSKQAAMYLYYKNEIGLEDHAPIMAARTMTTDEGQLLLLWVRLKAEESEVELDLGDEDDNGE